MIFLLNQNSNILSIITLSSVDAQNRTYPHQMLSHDQAQKYNFLIFSASGKKNRPSGKVEK
jgi:hypothetical protein